MIIRLIDIVLIVLFGFITISDIDIKAALSLPAKKSKKLSQVEKKPKVAFFVEIDKNEIFLIARQGERKVRKKGIVELDKYLNHLKESVQRREKKDIAVILKPMEDSPVQSTVDVLDLCEKHRIPKNIARKSLALF